LAPVPGAWSCSDRILSSHLLSFQGALISETSGYRHPTRGELAGCER
jgi:hypothetical protein